ncbi:MAG TPA: NAD(P)/FAD-dependent oxidoreductase [Blastocatellia bacterium]|nr:NAD(P)/FAD-dependent oxidoreductase [Blastocatellia bacterium]
MKKYDFIAIGGGNAGLTAVSNVAATGRSTALIDRGPIGGLCSLNGCNPKKVLVRSTEILQEIRHAAKFGIDVSDVHIDWSRVIDRKESFTNGVTEASEKSLKDQGIDLIKGSPKFVARNELEVNGDRIQVGSVVIATGSFPRPLGFPGADLVKTSNDILALREVPRDLVIIGSGVVAFEFGQVFARLGAKVTMLTPGKRALAGEDEDLVDILVEFSAKLGVTLLTEAKVSSIARADGRLRVEYHVSDEKRTVDADFVLNAAGRIPSIGDLALDKAEVKCDRRGVIVNEFLRSESNPDVFAAGDAHGRLQLSPIASYEGRVAAKNYLEGDTEPVDYESVSRSIYTIPPLASAGLTETEAKKRGLSFSVHNNNMTGWKVYAILGEPIAHSKILIESGTNKILGAHILGPSASDEIHIFALAIKFGITAEQLKNMVYAYPTVSSALTYALG